MSLTPEQVLHIAHLARISLTEADVIRFTAQLSGILDHFAALSALNTDGIEPTTQPVPLYNVMRSDSVASSLSRKDALRNAPEQEDGLFRVRAVLE